MTDSDAVHPRRGLQPLTWLVLGLTLALTFAGTLVTRAVVRDQEHRLLQQRAEEASVYLSGLIGSLEQALLGQLVPSVSPTAADVGQFPVVAAGLQKVAGYDAAVLVDLSGPKPKALSVFGSGDGLAARAVLDPRRSGAVDAAVAARKAFQAPFATTSLFTSGGKSHLGVAYAPTSARNVAIYTESMVHPFAQQPATSGQPFAELDAEVYAGPKRDRSQLLISSVPESRYPLSGLTSSFATAVGGGQKWLLVAKARQPLVGSVAEFTPWGILLGGLLSSALVVGAVELLARRRRYALDLVAERTAELEASLAELSAAQRQLVRQERLAAIGELASTIGHELRNPLGVLSNALYLLRADLGPAKSERAERHLATADREVSAASLIVSDLLEFARAREPVPVDFDVDGLVDEVLSVSPPPSGIVVDRPAPDRRITLSADRDQLRQVLLNLVGNAVQAMDGEGTLRLRLDSSDGEVHLVVGDTGMGMSPEVQAQVFEPFFTTKSRGVGLGLAVSRRIVEAHGGGIDVTSVEGEGSTFTVTLPRATIPKPRINAISPAEVNA